MKLTDGFVQIPRSLFRSEVWKKANAERRLAIVDLLSCVAYSEYEFRCDYGTWMLKKGEMVTNYGRLGKAWNMTDNQAKYFLKLLSGAKLISVRRITIGNHPFILLGVSDLCEMLPSAITDEIPRYKEENINNKIINNPLKKSPQGDFSPTSSKRSISREVRECTEDYRKGWRTLMDDEENKVARRFNNYLPEFLFVLCAKAENIPIINSSTNIPLVGSETFAVYMQDFFEYHVFDFVCNSGLTNRLRSRALRMLALSMHTGGKMLNIGQIALFFYYLRTADACIGPPRWRNGFNATEMMCTFNRFCERMERAE